MPYKLDDYGNPVEVSRDGYHAWTEDKPNRDCEEYAKKYWIEALRSQGFEVGGFGSCKPVAIAETEIFVSAAPRVGIDRSVATIFSPFSFVKTDHRGPRLWATFILWGDKVNYERWNYNHWEAMEYHWQVVADLCTDAGVGVSTKNNPVAYEALRPGQKPKNFTPTEASTGVYILI